MYQVLIVDSHPTVGMGIKFVLEHNQDFYVTYVRTGTLALEIKNNIVFDIMLCDLYSADMDSISLIKAMLDLNPTLKIFIFTGFAYEYMFNELIELGVCGFLSKTILPEEIKEKLYAGINGETVVPTNLFKRLRALEMDMVHESKTKISGRERQIINCIMNGMSNREVAEHIFLSQRGVEYHLSKLHQKFNVKSRTELIKYVIEHKLLHTEYLTK